MKKLPKNVTLQSGTPIFNQQTVPKGLLGDHSTASEVWGLIKVLEGSILYRILEPTIEEHILDPTHPGVVEPEVTHQVEIMGEARFKVEFYR